MTSKEESHVSFSNLVLIKSAMIKSALIVLQIVFLWLIFLVASYIVAQTGIPLPGGVLGMIIMFILLATGIIPERMVKVGADLLLSHLTLLFIPIAVGLMPLGSLFMSHWWSMLITVFVSVALGIAITGWVAQASTGKSS